VSDGKVSGFKRRADERDGDGASEAAPAAHGEPKVPRGAAAAAAAAVAAPEEAGAVGAGANGSAAAVATAADDAAAAAAPAPTSDAAAAGACAPLEPRPLPHHAAPYRPLRRLAAACGPAPAAVVDLTRDEPAAVVDMTSVVPECGFCFRTEAELCAANEAGGGDFWRLCEGGAHEACGRCLALAVGEANAKPAGHAGRAHCSLCTAAGVPASRLTLLCVRSAAAAALAQDASMEPVRQLDKSVVLAVLSSEGHVVTCCACKTPLFVERLLPSPAAGAGAGAGAAALLAAAETRSCTTCRALVCSGCGRRPHGARTCADVEREDVALATSALLRSTADLVVTPCAKCAVPLQHVRDDGCHRMTCTQCAAYTCFLCGSRMGSDPATGAVFSASEHTCPKRCSLWCDAKCKCAAAPRPARTPRLRT
jgi:hypothetical protein